MDLSAPGRFAGE